MTREHRTIGDYMEAHSVDSLTTADEEFIAAMALYFRIPLVDLQHHIDILKRIYSAD